MNVSSNFSPAKLGKSQADLAALSHALGLVLCSQIDAKAPKEDAWHVGRRFTRDGYAARISQNSVLFQHQCPATDHSETGLHTNHFLVYSDRVTTNQGIPHQFPTELQPHCQCIPFGSTFLFVEVFGQYA